MSADAEGPATDHIRLDVGDAAAVSDRGQRHHNNEDAVALERCDTPAGPIHVAVVCDGVSSAPGSKDASRLAADVAADVLVRAVAAGEIPADLDRTRAAIVAAIAAGSDAVAELAASNANAPATTMVAALIEPIAGGTRVHLGWLGDSRAYWLPYADDRAPDDRTPSEPDHETPSEPDHRTPSEPDLLTPSEPDGPRVSGARVLTRDHTVAAEFAAAASIPADRVDSLPGAHVITRWLGADARASDPELDTVDLAGPGLLVVCTDGLWNYFAAPADLAAAAGHAGPDGESPLEIAEQLTHLANHAGGHDNITVAIIPLG